MQLFLVRSDPVFNMLKPVHRKQWRARGGMEVVEPWKEVNFTQVEGADNDFIAVDCLTMNTGTDGFLISSYAHDVLAPLLYKAGQFWPVRVMGQPYWWHNCTALVEALDLKKTDADWSSVEGEWGSFKWISATRSLAFRPSQVKQAPAIFRVPEFPQGALFAQDALRLAVRNHGLIGFRFDLVWSSDLGGVLDPAGFSLGGIFASVPNNDLERQRRTARKLITERKRDM